MLGLILRTFIAICLFLPIAAMAASPAKFIGRVAKVKGDVLRSNRGLDYYNKLVDGNEIFEGDEINTSKFGYVKIILRDNTLFQIGNETRFGFENYNFLSTSRCNADYRFYQGKIRVILPGNEFKSYIRTTHHVIDLSRGEFLADVNDDGSNIISTFASVSGGLKIKSLDGKQVIIGKGEYFEYRGKDEEPLKVRLTGEVKNLLAKNNKEVFLFDVKNSVDDFYEAGEVPGGKEIFRKVDNYDVDEHFELGESKREVFPINRHYSGQRLIVRLKEDGVVDVGSHVSSVRDMMELRKKIGENEKGIGDIKDVMRGMRKTSEYEKEQYRILVSEYKREIAKHKMLLDKKKVLLWRINTSSRKVPSRKPAEQEIKRSHEDREHALRDSYEWKRLQILELENQQLVNKVNHVRKLKNRLYANVKSMGKEFTLKEQKQLSGLEGVEEKLLRKLKVSRRGVKRASQEYGSFAEKDHDIQDGLTRMPSSKMSCENVYGNRDRYLDDKVKKYFILSKYDINEVNKKLLNIERKKEFRNFIQRQKQSHLRIKNSLGLR